MPNNDYILRSDFTKAIEEWFMNDEDTRSLQRMLEEIPAADVEPKRNKGHWVPVFFEDDFDGYVHNDLDDPVYYQCDQCKFERKSPTRFCQHCGALMFPEEDPNAE